MAEGRLPDFLIIGAMRSGTTSLYRYLGAHPEIYLTPKELQFFTEHFERGQDWYCAQFAPAGTARVLGEATADYLARASAMTRIAATLPRARLIASLRNPVDRAWSHYGLVQARGREPRTFAEALDEETAALAAGGPDAPGVFYLSHGLYDVHLERCFRLFDRTQVAVTIFERMAADPEPVYRRLCSHLGVDPAFVPANLGEPVNPFVTFRSLRLRTAAQRLPSPLGRVVARFNTRRNVAAPPLDPATRTRLTDFYAPHVARTEELLGTPIPEWREEPRSIAPPSGGAIGPSGPA